jgi:hypothetical protein
MTATTGQFDTVPSEILAAIPEEIKAALEEELTDVTENLGERWIGGPWVPKDDHYRHERRHTQTDLDEIGAKRRERLAQDLSTWTEGLAPNRVHFLLYLWLKCWDLWDAYLVYRTLDVVEAAVREKTGTAISEPPEDWEPAAWRAAGSAISLITADANIFRQIILSDPDGLATAASEGAKTAKAVIGDIKAALDLRDDDHLTARGLNYIKQVAQENRLLYEFLAVAAKALTDFHGWLEVAPRLITSLPREPAAGRQASLAAARDRALQSIDEALSHFRSIQERLSGLVLSRAEPWQYLLNEVHAIVTHGADREDGLVFVPRQVSLRYCYPFAVETDEHPFAVEKRERGAGTGSEHSALKRRLEVYDLVTNSFNEKLKPIGIQVHDVKMHDPTAFFAARLSDSGLYRGIRVDLPDVHVSFGSPGGQSVRCTVWLVLSRMGNHCLCIEPAPLETPLPHVLYRATAAGTPFVSGKAAVVAGPASDPVAWDNLHSFSRDVIGAVAGADFWRADHGDAAHDNDRYMRGNLHEVLIAHTDGPIGTQPDDVSERLNSALGGRILLRSIQRSATTIDEWVRYPPATPSSGRGDGISEISDLPEMGLAGDWCAYTGETTVFGIVAAPSWHSAVYLEAAQFAASWSPLLRLWNSRLQEAMKRSDPSADSDARGYDSEELRKLEQKVRQHLAQINSEELCATLTHRRFLDRLLKMEGIGRLQDETERQLLATERLIDWWTATFRSKSEDQRQQTDRRREGLLGVIALFGIFEMGGFLELANSTSWHQGFFGLFTLREGVWEDWILTSLFTAALLIGFRFFNFFGVNDWLGRALGNIRPHSRGRAKAGRVASESEARRRRRISTGEAPHVTAGKGAVPEAGRSRKSRPSIPQMID